MILAHICFGCVMTVIAATSSPATQEATTGPERDGLLLRTSDLDIKKVLDPMAGAAKLEFTAKLLRFAITASQSNFEPISEDIERVFSKAMELGRPTLTLAVVDTYANRAERYSALHNELMEKDEAREALDTAARAVFYGCNKWVYWAGAAATFLDTAEDKTVYAPLTAERYSKVAIALAPREPWPYGCLVESHFLREQYEKAERIAGRALEIADLDKASTDGWKGDQGRAWFNDYRGRCQLKLGHPDRARDYLQKAWSLGRNEDDVQPFLGEAVAELAGNSTPLKLGENPKIGCYQGMQDSDRNVIVSVTPNTPASEADLQVGDVIARIDGLPAVDRNKQLRLVPARNAVLDGGRKRVLLEIHRGDQVLYFMMTK